MAKTITQPGMAHACWIGVRDFLWQEIPLDFMVKNDLFPVFREALTVVHHSKIHP